MHKAIIILILLIGYQSFSQEPISKSNDSITYDYYINKQWKELIAFSKKSTLQNYYFNVRIGVAYFYEREYHSAE